MHAASSGPVQFRRSFRRAATRCASNRSRPPSGEHRVSCSVARVRGSPSALNPAGRRSTTESSTQVKTSQPSSARPWRSAASSHASRKRAGCSGSPKRGVAGTAGPARKRRVRARTQGCAGKGCRCRASGSPEVPALATEGKGPSNARRSPAHPCGRRSSNTRTTMRIRTPLFVGPRLATRAPGGNCAAESLSSRRGLTESNHALHLQSRRRQETGIRPA